MTRHLLALLSMLLAVHTVRGNPEPDPAHEASAHAHETSAPALEAPAHETPTAVPPAAHAAVEEKKVEAAAVPAAPTVLDLAKRDEARGLLKLGATLTDRKDYPNAEHAFRTVIERRGFTVEERQDALIGLARVFRGQGNLTKSAAILEKFITEFPGAAKLPAVMLESGRVLRAMGAYQLAIARFYAVINSTLKVDQSAFGDYQLLARTAQFEVAETYFVAGNYAEASKYFRRVGALELAPADQARAQFKAAYAQQLGGDLEGAVSALKIFIGQWPEDESCGEARFLLATTLRQIGHNNEALAVTLDLLKSERPRSVDGSKRWIYWQRRTGNQLANDFFQNGDVMSAVTLYRQLVEMSPEPAWKLSVRYQIALCEDRLGQIAEAKNDYQTIVDQTAPKSEKEVPDDLAELGRMAAWRLGQIQWRDEAEHRLAAVAATKPTTSPTWTPSSSSSNSSPNSTISPSPKADSSSSTGEPRTIH